MIKKLILLAGLVGFPFGMAHAATFKTVLASTAGVVQAGMTGYSLHLSSGALDNFNSTNTAITGTLTLPAGSTMTVSGITSISSATIAANIARFSQVKIIQVVSYTVAAASATTSTTYVASNLSGSITPQFTSSKILVMVSGQLRALNISVGANGTILRGGSNILVANGMCYPVSAGVVTDGLDFPCSMTYLDSPNTTSSTTYAVGIKAGGATTATWTNQSTTSSITLIEVNGL